MATTKKSWLSPGLIFVLSLLFGFGIYFLVVAIIKFRSGCTRQLTDGTWVDCNAHFLDNGEAWYAVILLVCGTAAYLIMRSER